MDRESVEITSRAQWREWLTNNHDNSSGIWLVYFKKGAAEAVPYEELVLEALCFGWVDSQARDVDELRTSITMTPRRPVSRWTQPNRDRVETLEAAGLMTPAGRAVIAQAKSLGTWDELRPVENLELPDDLAQALAGRLEQWEALSRSARFQHLLALHDAKRPETRSRKITAILDSLNAT